MMVRFQTLLSTATCAPTTWPESLYPVPVRVSNIAKNQNAAADDDVLVRRFFIVDETAGVAVAGAAAVAVTYAQSMLFTVRVRSDEKAGPGERC